MSLSLTFRPLRAISLPLLLSFLLILVLLPLSHQQQQHNQQLQQSIQQPKRASCKGLWRPDELPGKCFGLRESSKIPAAAAFRSNSNIISSSSSSASSGPVGALAEGGVGAIGSAEECRRLCCFLGDECVTWQYHQVS